MTAKEYLSQAYRLDEQINCKIEQLSTLNEAEITKVIKSVDDVDQRFILEKRYLCWAPWPEIAVEMNISNRWMYHLHDLALEEIQRKISNMQ